jgi:Family of unknown function (DUF5317)
MLTLVALLLLPVLAGLVAGWLRGGRPARLAALRPRAPWLAWLAVPAQLAQAYAPAVRRVVEADLGVPMLLLVYAPVGLWLVVNLPGRPVGVRVAVVMLLLGGSMNGVAIAANGRMPFSVVAAQRAGVPAAKVAATDLPKNEQATAETRLAWLGDNLPVRPLRKVVSAGDLVIVLGVALLVTTVTSAWQQAPRDPDAQHT